MFLREKFREVIGGYPGFTEGYPQVEIVTDLLKKAQDLATRIIRRDAHGSNVYWWSEELEVQRSRAIMARKRYTRLIANRRADEGEVENPCTSYKEKRRILRKAIAKSKVDHWRKVCDKLEQEGYKIVMRALHQDFPKTGLYRDRRTAFANALFPETEVTVREMEGVEDPMI